MWLHNLPFHARPGALPRADEAPFKGPQLPPGERGERSSAPDPARRPRWPRLLPAKAPKGKTTVNLLNADGSIWTRVHLDKRIWEAIGGLAERLGKTMDEISDEAFQDAINGLGGLAGFMERSEAADKAKAAAA